MVEEERRVKKEAKSNEAAVNHDIVCACCAKEREREREEAA